MPKRGWKWWTERCREMEPEELEELLRDPERRVSARLARWIYENLAGESDRLRIPALERIAWDETAPWNRTFLWRELEKHKGDKFGDWLVVALTRPGADDARDAERFIDLYEDETAHPMTRGSAVFGLSNCANLASFNETPHTRPFSPEIMSRVRETCAKAIRDESNPYARAGACWLAQKLGGFEEELAERAKDFTPQEPGSTITVADHCS